MSPTQHYNFLDCFFTGVRRGWGYEGYDTTQCFAGFYLMFDVLITALWGSPAALTEHSIDCVRCQNKIKMKMSWVA